MYASIWLWGIAQGMLLANWLAGWSVIPVFAAMYFIRTPREERLMVDTFGEDYRRYSRQTGRLIPRLTRVAETPHAGAGSPCERDSSTPGRCGRSSDM
jgi:protein-S-isoprenylcysteine O-methyltransferase Ste14